MALLLAYMSFRGSVDNDPAAAQRVSQIPEMMRLQDVTNLDDYEVQFLNAPAGTLTERERMQSAWLVEDMGTLGWALGMAELPRYYESFHGAAVARDLGMFRPGAEKELHPVLREAEEIIDMAVVYFLLVTRLSAYAKDRQRIDFAARFKDQPRRDVLLKSLEIGDGDLLVDGMRLDELSPDELSVVTGIVYQRCKAFRWLLGFDDCYQTLPPVIH